jgi:hypothetical protein
MDFYAPVPVFETVVGQVKPGYYEAKPLTGSPGEKPDVVLLSCQPPGENTLSPEVAVESYFWKTYKQKLDSDNAKVELLEAGKKAGLTYYQGADGRKGAWTYKGNTLPPAEYDVKKATAGGYQSTKPDGLDQVTFVVKVKNLTTGKDMLIKVIERLGVTGVKPPNADDNTTIDCGPTIRIKTGSLDNWMHSAELSAVLAAASGMDLQINDIPGSAVGNTIGQGPTAQITLNSDAAGHGWSTPLDHTADSHDFMAETLQAGQRRLPTADELQLMAKLVAQRKAMQVI